MVGVDRKVIKKKKKTRKCFDPISLHACQEYWYFEYWKCNSGLLHAENFHK